MHFIPIVIQVKFIAKTFAGLEPMLSQELRQAGASDVQELTRAVSFCGDTALLYKVNYTCRLVLRVLLVVKEFSFKTNEDFYKSVFNIDLTDYLDKDAAFCVHSVVTESIFYNSQYTNLLTKDAICDRYRDMYDCRPSIDKQNPDVAVEVHVYRDTATISLDSSVMSLHRREYKTSKHQAALNEVMAAGIIALSGWNADCDLIDFMCGSGTILIEAAMKALNMPAGYYRTSGYGFMTWKNFDENLWNHIRTQADNAMNESTDIRIYGSDINYKYIRNTKENIEQLRLDDIIILAVDDFADTAPARTPAYVIINPPYGERLQIEKIENFYQSIGNILKKKYINCIAGILTSNKQAMKSFGLKCSQKYNVYNAELESIFYVYQMYSGSKKQKSEDKIEPSN